MQYHENFKLSTRDSEECTDDEKLLIGFSSSSEPEIEEILDGSQLSLRTDQPTSLVFLSFLVKFHRDRGIDWRGLLYPAYPVLLQSPTTHIPCILQWFWHTLLHVRIYSSQKQNIVIPKMMSEANSSHSPLFLGRERGNVQNYKLWKFVENQEKKEIYISKKHFLGLVAL